MFINFGQVLSSVYSRLQLSDKDYNHSQMEYEQYISVQCVTAMNWQNNVQSLFSNKKLHLNPCKSQAG